MQKKFMLLVAVALFTGSAAPVVADTDKDESGRGRSNYERGEYRAPKQKGGEQKEEYRDGNCRVERKWSDNGSYKEEWKCDAGKVAASRAEHKEEYWDGNCKVERKWDKKGGYKEERKCERR